MSILVPANISDHKIREIGGYRYKSRFFFSKTRRSTYILTFIFLTVQDGSLQRYMGCLSEFVEKSAVTKYTIKNYICKSIVVSGHRLLSPQMFIIKKHNLVCLTYLLARYQYRA